MKTKIALLQLTNLINNQSTPAGVSALIQQNKHLDVLNTIKNLSEKVITETETEAFIWPERFERTISHKWKTIVTLLDHTHRHFTAHPDLHSIYLPMQNSLLSIHSNFWQNFAEYYPKNYKIADTLLFPAIHYMHVTYLNLVQTDKNNQLLKAILYPVLLVTKHTGKGYNTHEKIQFAQTLLCNIRLWRLKKGTDDDLYEIAIAMNINCPHLIKYLWWLSEELLNSQTSQQKKIELVNRWHQQHCLACCKNNWRTTDINAFNTKAKSLTATVNEWLHVRKSNLEYMPTPLQPLYRICVDGNSEYLSWYMRFTTEAGLYQSKVVAHPIRALGQVISLPDAEIPSIKNLELICSRTTIPEKTKNKLIDFGNNFLNIVHRMPTKEQQEKENSKPAKNKSNSKK